MLDWKKICCPIDFSDSSHAAMQDAAELARRFGAELMLLFVYEMAAAPEDILAAPPPPVLQEVLRDCDAQLAAWKARAEHLAGSSVIAERRIGPPAKEILRAAREHRFDLIVMATHGRTGLRHAVFGSVAEKVIRQARCPVLTIRPPELEEHRATDWP